MPRRQHSEAAHHPRTLPRRANAFNAPLASGDVAKPAKRGRCKTGQRHGRDAIKFDYPAAVSARKSGCTLIEVLVFLLFDFLVRMLSVAGHRVITAADGEEAIGYALRVPFDLIVLDLCLPKVDGIGVIKELRSSRAAQTTPIITVSAADELMHTEALAAGADLALEKPCLPDELQAAVRSFLDEDRRRQGKKGRAQ